jgi:flap endonuclease-1
MWQVDPRERITPTSGDGMGTPIGPLIPRKEVELPELSTKLLAIDGYNALYQFISVIRQPDGTPLMDRQGRITSHLSGLFYRTIKLLENGIKVVYVFDGKPPEFKHRTVEERMEKREEAEKKWQEALKKGDIEEARKYATQASRLEKIMVEDSKRLLEAMGVPYVLAPSEGEAQASYMAAKGDVWATASQDYDSLLFGSPRLVRNLAITGKRKLPGRNIYVDVKPELIILQEVLQSLGIDRIKLIWIGMLVGTDFNEKIPGIGPKKALELVRSHNSFEEILKVLGVKPDWDWKAIEEFFLNPPHTDDYDLKYRKPDRDTIFRILVEEHDFSPERVEKAVGRLEEVTPAAGSQSSLEAWFG